jgi:hypothetical protein
MDEASLRALVRDAVARHVAAPIRSGPAAGVSGDSHSRSIHGADSTHASHHIYLHLVGGTDACLIEPAVECTHCGYCKSHGH